MRGTLQLMLKSITNRPSSLGCKVVQVETRCEEQQHVRTEELSVRRRGARRRSQLVVMACLPDHLQ